MDALSESLERNPGLQLDVQLDLNRCTRPGQSSTAHLLLPLLQAHPERVTVHLFRSPHLRGILANIVPPRFNEGWGTWHAKIYGADDEVIISGYVPNSFLFLFSSLTRHQERISAQTTSRIAGTDTSHSPIHILRTTVAISCASPRVFHIVFCRQATILPKGLTLIEETVI